MRTQIRHPFSGIALLYRNVDKKSIYDIMNDKTITRARFFAQTCAKVDQLIMK